MVTTGHFKVFFEKAFQEHHQSGRKSFIGSALGPSCLQRLSADDTVGQEFNKILDLSLPQLPIFELASNEGSRETVVIHRLFCAFAISIKMISKKSPEPRREKTYLPS